MVIRIVSRVLRQAREVGTQVVFLKSFCLSCKQNSHDRAGAKAGEAGPKRPPRPFRDRPWSVPALLLWGFFGAAPLALGPAP